MKINVGEIELTKAAIQTLGNWASVSRTLDEAYRCLIDPERDRSVILDELEAIQRPLDALHQAVRSTIWLNQCGAVLRQSPLSTIVCRLPKNHQGPC